MRIECVVPSRSTLGEGAWWDAADQVLWWVDIPEGLIHRFNPATSMNDTFAFGEPVGCVVPREAGGLVVAAKSGFWFFDPETRAKSAVCDPEPDLGRNRFNDGSTDSRGRFWAGTMQEGKDAEPAGQFYRLDIDHSVRAWKDNMVVTNGLAFSPDGERMFFAETSPDVQTVFVCDYDPETGEPGRPRCFFDTHDLEGRPDGATVDADGCYWLAGVDGWAVYQISPDGEYLRSINMPVQKPSRPMFGGPELDVLYVTSIKEGTTDCDEKPQPEAGSLFAIYDTGARGFPQKRFAG